MTLNNECAAGIYPLATKGNPNNVTGTTPLMREQFAPRNVDNSDPDNPTGRCHLCEQPVPIKTREPRKGFYMWHKSSAAGYKAFGDTRSGKPARTRRT
jgi:hypothetical protein